MFLLMAFLRFTMYKVIWHHSALSLIKQHVVKTYGGVEVQLYTFLTMKGQIHALAALLQLCDFHQCTNFPAVPIFSRRLSFTISNKLKYFQKLTQCTWPDFFSSKIANVKFTKRERVGFIQDYVELFPQKHIHVRNVSDKTQRDYIATVQAVTTVATVLEKHNDTNDDNRKPLNLTVSYFYLFCRAWRSFLEHLSYLLFG
jgi:hypothetical protein